MLRIVYEEVYTGGAEMLFLRLGRYYLKKGIEVRLFYEFVYSEKMLQEFVDIGMGVCRAKKTSEDAFFDVKSEDIILTVTLDTYIDCLLSGKRKGSTAKVLYYSVHRLVGLHNTRSKFYNRMAEGLYKRIIKSAIEEGSLFFMDNCCAESFFFRYQVDKDNKKNIVYLPMEIKTPRGSEISDKIKVRNDGCNILSIARADFPFKGYLKGLIEIYAELYRNNERISLTLVSAGDGIGELKGWIHRAQMQGIEGISLYEDVKPTDLKEFYYRASVYVGMGTTLLEACQNFVPPIPIQSYTFDCLGWGTFAEHYDFLGVPDGEGIDIRELLLSIIRMSDIEYEELVEKCREAFENLYDIRNFQSYIDGVSCNLIGLNRVEWSILQWEMSVKRYLRGVRHQKYIKKKGQHYAHNE